MSQRFLLAAGLCVVAILFLTVGCAAVERKLLFFPSHHPSSQSALKPWDYHGQTIGFARSVPTPKTVWLMFHGNGGQAADREYALPCFSPQDSVYIMEYPGYGDRKGTPSKTSFNTAAQEAYLYLRETYPNTPVCVVGESIGNGPAASLASVERPPDKFILVVPFDKLSKVAAEHYPSWLVSALLRDDWDNIPELLNYKGPIEIYGAKNDTIIPVQHAQALAAALPGSKLVILDCEHNDWSYKQVSFRGAPIFNRLSPQ